MVHLLTTVAAMKMTKRFRGIPLSGLFVVAVLLMTAGCRILDNPIRGLSTPVKSGLNTRDLIDSAAQKEADELLKVSDVGKVGDEVRQAVLAKARAAYPDRMAMPPKNVLCLSGGGSFGAFTAGYLNGWTANGTRPVFDVVTGISTGALIAPLAFLGPQYDPEIKKFYTEITTRDVYVTRFVRGIVSEALADNGPLVVQVDRVLTPKILCEIAQAHREGRRLYVGTTELEGKRFVVWDIGAIAAKGGEENRQLIRQILIGSAAIPGFFPSSKIVVTVDGKKYYEKHGDGGTSSAIFFRPPYMPEADRQETDGLRLAGTKIWCVVAGKLYADPDPLRARALTVAGTSVSSIIYAQTRGDLQRIFTLSLLSGMDYNIASMDEAFAAPKSSTAFDAEPLLSMYNEGFREANSEKPWRKTPPGGRPNEGVLERGGTDLILSPRGGPSPILGVPAADGTFTPMLPGTGPITK